MKKVIDFLERLVGESRSLRQDARTHKVVLGEEGQDVYQQRRTRWMRSSQDVLKYADLGVYAEQVAEIFQMEHVDALMFAKVAGVLESARDCLREGFVGNVRYLLHAEMFGSLLEQAKELFESGHNTPAAVLGRIVLERWLRDEAAKTGIQNADTAKASILNDGLKSAGLFSVPRWRHVQSLLDVGNAAAHGQESTFSVEDVRRLLMFAESNCV